MVAPVGQAGQNEFSSKKALYKGYFWRLAQLPPPASLDVGHRWGTKKGRQAGRNSSKPASFLLECLSQTRGWNSALGLGLELGPGGWGERLWQTLVKFNRQQSWR